MDHFVRERDADPVSRPGRGAHEGAARPDAGTVRREWGLILLNGLKNSITNLTNGFIPHFTNYVKCGIICINFSDWMRYGEKYL